MALVYDGTANSLRDRVTDLEGEVFGPNGSAYRLHQKLTGVENLDAATVLSPGGGTARTLAEWMGDVVHAGGVVSIEGSPYFAAGDGTTDDTAAIQAALNAGARLVRGVPGHTYLVSDELLVPSNRVVDMTGANLVRKASSLAAGEALFFRNADYTGGNANIHIIGGEYDGNNANQTRSDLTGYVSGVGMRFKNVTDLTVERVKITNPKTFAVQLGNVTRFRISDVAFNFTNMQANMDGIHVNGGCSNGRIERLSGNTNDDCVALNTEDGAVYQLTAGPITDVTIDQVHCTAGYRGVRLLSGTSKLSGITIEGVRGAYTYAPILISNYNLGASDIEDVTIRDLQASTTGTTEALVHVTTNVKSLSVEGVKRTQAGSTTRLEVVRVTGAYTVSRLSLSGIQVNDTTAAGTGILTVDSGATVASLVTDGIQLDYSGAGGGGNVIVVQGAGSALSDAELSGVRMKGAGRLLYCRNSGSVGRFRADGIAAESFGSASGTGLVQFTSTTFDDLSLVLSSAITGFVTDLVLVQGAGASGGRVSIQGRIKQTAAAELNVVRVGSGVTVDSVSISQTHTTDVDRLVRIDGGTVNRLQIAHVDHDGRDAARQHAVAVLATGGVLGFVSFVAVVARHVSSLLTVGAGCTASRVKFSGVSAPDATNLIFPSNFEALGGALRIEWDNVDTPNAAFGQYPISAVSVNGLAKAVDLAKLTPATYDVAMHDGTAPTAAGPYWYNGAAWAAM